MEKNDCYIAKVLIILGLSVLLLVSAVVEGYTNYLQGYIILFFSAVLSVCLIIAFTISVPRLVGLIFFGFVIGFLTQAIGVTSDMWCYEHTFIFAALSWSLAAVTMEGISKILRFKLEGLTDNPLNVIMIFALFSILLVTLPLQDYWKYARYRPIPKECAGKQESKIQTSCLIYQTMPEEGSEEFKLKFEPNEPFWIYYISLTGFAIVMHYSIPFTELLSLILAAWMMGGISEWIGATAGLWHFRTVPFPPLFLVLGCWPLEFLIMRGLSRIEWAS